MILSAKRKIELERLLRRLRQIVFDNEKAYPLIGKVKARLADTWAQEYNARHQYHWMYAAE